MLINMTEGDPVKLIIPFVVPLLIGNIFQQMYNIADIIIVGRTIGVEALAAVGAVTPLFMLSMVLTIGLSNGFTVVTGQRYGSGDMQGMRRSICSCIFLSAIFVLLIMGIMHIIVDPMLVAMNIPMQLLADSRAYTMIIVDGLFAMMGYNLLSGIMRSLGDSKTPLYFLIVASVINIILALVFIQVFGWGVPGSAYALVIAQAISAVLCAIYIYVRFPQLHISLKDFDCTWPELWAHLRMGLPMAVQFSVLGIGIIIVQAVCNSFGADAIAGFTSAIRVEQLALQPLISFGIAMAVFTAQNFGARRFDRIREAVKRISRLVFAFSFCAAVVITLFGNQIVNIFLENPTTGVAEASRLYLWYTVPFYIVLSQIFIFRNACQGMGVAMIPMLSSVVELLSRCFCAILLSKWIGYIGLCFAQPISWFSSCVFVFFSYRYFIRVLEEKNRIVDEFH